MSHGKLTSLTATALFVVATMALPVSRAAGVAGVGEWRGVVRSDTGLVRATLVRKGDRLDIHFGEPHNCRIPAQLLGEENEAARFRFGPSSNGGRYCDSLYPGELRLSDEGDGVRLVFARAAHPWTGILTVIAEP
ncbi:hypothetical protein KPL74_15230 [Bacillus sp. NP157]|nr:hypothetical protein KPL74_15230 [Bacillus sp. NP157]